MLVLLYLPKRRFSEIIMVKKQTAMAKVMSSSRPKDNTEKWTGCCPDADCFRLDEYGMWLLVVVVVGDKELVTEAGTGEQANKRGGNQK